MVNLTLHHSFTNPLLPSIFLISALRFHFSTSKSHPLSLYICRQTTHTNAHTDHTETLNHVPGVSTMSCNGCRVLRKGCSDSCILRPCLQWIDTPEAQGHATVFVAKFFGRAGLMSFISAVPENQRPSLFQSLLFEAAGRTVNPVNGAVGLLWTGNWHVCQASVDTVLRGGTLRPIPELSDGFPTMQKLGDSSEVDVTRPDLHKLQDPVTHPRSKVQKRRRACEPPSNIPQSHDLELNINQSFPAAKGLPEKRRQGSPSMNSEDSVTTTCLDGGFGEYNFTQGGREVHLLNLFK